MHANINRTKSLQNFDRVACLRRLRQRQLVNGVRRPCNLTTRALLTTNAIPAFALPASCGRASMQRFLRRQYPRIRQGTLLACAVAYLATTLGVPAPAVTMLATDTKPFPCQGHHCGCRSAEQCAQRCCCFTRAQQKAWYAANGHTAPPSIAAASDTKRDTQTGSCCQVRHRLAGRQTSVPASRWSLSVGASKCQGLVSFWLTAGAVLPPPAPVDHDSIQLACAWLSMHDDTSPTAIADPPVPPPRLELA